MTRLPAMFLSHGGGPWPYLTGPLRDEFNLLEASLKALLPNLPVQPKAILVVTAHWETHSFMLSSSRKPPMIYDYGGFPEHTYHVTYNAPGSPELAERACKLITTAGMDCGLDRERGFDHGTFSLMEIVRPQADIPVVQLSIRQDFDPQAHIAAGRALAPLRDEGILIVGSGLSYHNLQKFGPDGADASWDFDLWLKQTLMTMSGAQRNKQMCQWEAAPAARLAHPSEDHLLPLFVALGSAEADPCAINYSQSDFMGHLTVSSFRFG